MNPELMCAGLLALLLFGLGLAVSVERGKAGKLGGVPADEETRLFRMIRAHGNASEYVPIAGAMALYFATQQSSPLVLALLVGLTAARYIHAAALIGGKTMNRFNIARFIGGMGTYITGAGLSLILIVQAF